MFTIVTSHIPVDRMDINMLISGQFLPQNGGDHDVFGSFCSIVDIHMPVLPSSTCVVTISLPEMNP